MKLYTEEEVKRAIGVGMHIGYSNQFNINYVNNEVDKAIKHITPIELPSDEEIVEISEKGYVKLDGNRILNWINGAKWMKEQILNQNK